MDLVCSHFFSLVDLLCLVIRHTQAVVILFALSYCFQQPPMLNLELDVVQLSHRELASVILLCPADFASASKKARYDFVHLFNAVDHPSRGCR